MDSPLRFRTNTPEVIHETIDGEAVIVNLDTGNYYSLLKSGADMWSLITGGATVDETTESMAKLFEGDAAKIRDAVSLLVDSLRQENLIVPDEVEREAVTPEQCVEAETAPANGKPVFEAPGLQKYGDMQDLLLLDPIHEIDQSGWPNEKPNADDANQ